MESDTRKRTPHMGAIQARIKSEKSDKKGLTFPLKHDIILPVMRGKENIQARIKHWEAKLTDIQNRLTEIEFSEPIITLPPSKINEKSDI